VWGIGVSPGAWLAITGATMRHAIVVSCRKTNKTV
jgi:hypothetical protein